MTVALDRQRAADRLARDLVGFHTGEVRVEGASAEVTTNHFGDWVVFLTVHLPDPKGETWPYRDVLALRLEIQRRAESCGVDVPVSDRMKPRTNHPMEDDDLVLFDT